MALQGSIERQPLGRAHLWTPMTLAVRCTVLTALLASASAMPLAATGTAAGAGASTELRALFTGALFARDDSASDVARGALARPAAQPPRGLYGAHP